MKHISRPFIVIFIVIAVIFFAIAYKTTGRIYPKDIDTLGSIKISASFYTLTEFARHVSNENVDVITITPKGVEPHDFEPSPRDILDITSSDIFIFNGTGFDPWADKLAVELSKKDIPTINITNRLDTNINDPHTWLDPVLAKKSVEIIRDELLLIDPSNAQGYNDNARRYIQELSELDTRYRDGLQNCEIRDAIASHNAFGYLANRYKIKIIPISGISPDQEPSARKMGEISKLASQKKIKYIFFEPLASPKLAETIASEIGAKMLTLNPIESLTESENERGENYISIMNNNLENLRVALRCI